LWGKILSDNGSTPTRNVGCNENKAVTGYKNYNVNDIVIWELIQSSRERHLRMLKCSDCTNGSATFHLNLFFELVIKSIKLRLM
jgi:hypothetical protein